MAFDSQIEEIKNRLDIVEVISGYIRLKKTGVNYRGICPFHSEKKPSFFVSPVRQIWHCFGCGAGGDVFSFVKQIEGIEFGDALRILAQRAGIELKRQDPKLKTIRQRLYEICDLACLFFQKQLEASVAGKEAKKYLLGRGIKEESIKKWRLGYGPDVWEGLSDFLVSKGYEREEIEKAGLAIKSDKSQGFYDRFRGRIIFPIFDLNSQVIGFGGRIFKKTENEEEIAKYINTPQTLLYDKSKTLYGLNNAKVAIRKHGFCVITEGYTDVIMAHQSGFENTIAVSGTALTPFHLNILKRYTENLVLAFDMDIAGDTATKRGIDLAQEQGFNIKIIKQIMDNSDPADVILRDPKEWEKAVGEARSILDFYFDSTLSAYDKNTPEGKKAIGRIILPVIKRIPNKIEQSFWIQKLATTLSVKEEIILEELKKTKIEPTFSVNYFPETASISAAASGGDGSGGGLNTGFIESTGRKRILEEKIIALIAKNPDNLNLIDEKHLVLFSDKVKKFLEEFKQFIAESDLKERENFKKILNEFLKTRQLKSSLTRHQEYSVDEELANFIDALSLRAEVEYDEDEEEEIQICLGELKSLDVRDRLRTISEEIKKAEERKDMQKVNILIEEFNKLSKEL